VKSILAIWSQTRASVRRLLASRVVFELRPWILGGIILALPLTLLVLGPTPWRLANPLTKNDPPDDRGFSEHFVGEFHESNRAFPDAPLQIEMKLFAEVPHAQDEEFKQLVAGQENRYREAVSGVLRSLPPRDLREPTLTTLKRKMKVAMVATAGIETNLFDELVVPEFDAYQVN
jgi:hypothetical protein